MANVFAFNVYAVGRRICKRRVIYSLGHRVIWILEKISRQIERELPALTFFVWHFVSIKWD
jgi:hypothetical protein